MDDRVEVVIDWLAEPTLVVDRVDGRLRVTADARLSEHQVAAACRELDADGPAVLEAWRSRIGWNGGARAT